MTTGAEASWAAIVLAAGAGRRFGGGKLLAEFEGRPLLAGALEAALASPAQDVILVTGAQAEAVGAIARTVAGATAKGARLRIVHAPDHEEGMGASLRAAAAALPMGIAGAFILLGDMPKVPAAILPRLAQSVRDGAAAAAPTHNGRRGHPVLIGRDLLPALAQLSGDKGARAILAGLGKRMALVETHDPGVLFDVDRPEDLTPL